MSNIRCFLLPFLHPTTISPRPLSSHHHHTTKKRISTSLQDDLVDPERKKQDSQQEYSEPATPTTTNSSPLCTTTFLQNNGYWHHLWPPLCGTRLVQRPTRSSQHKAILPIRALLSHHHLIQEMHCGLVRIVLEFKEDSLDSELSGCSLHSVPLWALFCNGRKLGFAFRKKATKQNRLTLKTMQSIKAEAGVLPSGFGPAHDSEELLYMRDNFECIVGSADSESFHPINPDEGPGQELSVFLLRSK